MRSSLQGNPVFVTRGKRKFKPALLKPCSKVVTEPGNKPECSKGSLLWTSPLTGTTTPWLKAIVHEWPEWVGSQAVIFKKPNVQVLEIRGRRDYYGLLKLYPPTQRQLDRASSNIDTPLNWEEVAKDYAAVHVTKNAIRTVNDLDLWDFDSTVWFDPSVLTVETIVPVDKKTGTLQLDQREDFMQLGNLKYTQAETNSVYNDKSFRWDGVQFHIEALVQSKTGENLPGKGTKYCKKVKKIPPEVDKDLKGEHRVQAEEAAQAGELWFINIPGEGWNWKEKKGTKMVDLIHEIVIWLQAFETKEKAHSAKAFYIEITTNPL